LACLSPGWRLCSRCQVRVALVFSEVAHPLPQWGLGEGAHSPQPQWPGSEPEHWVTEGRGRNADVPFPLERWPSWLGTGGQGPLCSWLCHYEVQILSSCTGREKGGSLVPNTPVLLFISFKLKFS
jgi:hypothetical protein